MDFTFPGIAADYAISGVPAATLSNGGLSADIIQFNDPYVSIHFPSAPGYPTTLHWPELDRAFRRNSGAFARGIDVTLDTSNWPPITAPVTPWSVTGIGSTTAVLAGLGSYSFVYMKPTGIIHSNLQGDALSYVTGGGTIGAVFPSSILAGEIFSITSGQGSMWQDNGDLWNADLAIVVH